MFFYVVFLSVGGWARSAGAACGRSRSRCWVAVGRALKNRLDSPASCARGEIDHLGGRRSRPSAKKAQRMDVVVRRNSLTSHSRSLRRWRSSVRTGAPSALPPGLPHPLARGLRLRSDFSAIEQIAAHCKWRSQAQELPLNPGRSPALRNSQPPHLRRSGPISNPLRALLSPDSVPERPQSANEYVGRPAEPAPLNPRAGPAGTGSGSAPAGRWRPAASCRP